MLPHLDLRTSLQVTRNHGLLTSLPRWAVFIMFKAILSTTGTSVLKLGPCCSPGAPRTEGEAAGAVGQTAAPSADTLSADRQVFPSCPPAHAHSFLPVVPALSSSVARVTEGIDAALWPAQSWYTGLHSSRRTLQHGKTRTHTSRPVLKQPCRCAPLYGSNSETISAK